MTSANFQTITAIFSSLSAVLGFALALRNLPRLTNWLKKREILIAERNVAIARMGELQASLTDARSSVSDLRNAMDSLRSMNDDLSARVDAMEEIRPIYDAFMAWFPLGVEWMTWIEQVARKADLDLGGRQMPAVPEPLIPYLRNLNSRNRSEDRDGS